MPDGSSVLTKILIAVNIQDAALDSQFIWLITQ